MEDRTRGATAFRLDDRVAVVTGAGSGIGRAIAEVLGAAGASIVACDINQVTLADAVDGLTAAGVAAVGQITDVVRREQLDEAVELAMAEFGRLDIQCNVAGAPPLDRELVNVTDEDLDRELSISLKGILHGCQAAAAPMTVAGSGAILNMSSTSIDLPAARTGLYHLGKVSSAALTRVLAAELGPHGIRVNAIAPGVTMTPFSARHFTSPDGDIDEARREAFVAGMAAMSPLGLIGDPVDQALLALYLVSDAARFVTGQVIRANGGWSMP